MALTLMYYFEFSRPYYCTDPIYKSVGTTPDEDRLIKECISGGKNIEKCPELRDLLQRAALELIPEDSEEYSNLDHMESFYVLDDYIAEFRKKWEPESSEEETTAEEVKETELDKVTFGFSFMGYLEGDILKCDNCGCIFVGDPVNTGEMTPICPKCLNEEFIKCKKCDIWVNKYDAEQIGEDYFCDECAEEFEEPEVESAKTKSIEDIKYVIYQEGEYDPPAGAISVYYAEHSNSYEMLLLPIDEMYEHLMLVLYDEDADELQELYDSREPTKEYIQNFRYEAEGMDCGCVLFAEGKEIASKAVEFFNSEFEIEEDTEEEEKAKEKILEEALANPEDVDAVLRLLDLMDEYIDQHNDSMF